MRNLEEWCEAALFTQLFKCCTSPKKTTSAWQECLSHVQPWDQKSSLHWAASPTSANASSPCLPLTCPECWIGWWPWRAWNKAHFGCGIPPVRLSSPDQTDLSGSEHIRHINVTMNQWTKLHTSSSWQNTKGLTCNCSWKYGADMESVMLWLRTLLQSGRTQLAPNRIYDRSSGDTQEEPKTSFYSADSLEATRVIPEACGCHVSSPKRVRLLWRRFRLHHISKSKKFFAENQADRWPKI